MSSMPSNENNNNVWSAATPGCGSRFQPEETSSVTILKPLLTNSGAEPGPEYRLGFRPVIENAPYHIGKAFAGFEQRDTRGLEGDLNSGIHFQHLRRREEDPRFTQIHSFPRRPILLSLEAVT